LKSTEEAEQFFGILPRHIAVIAPEKENDPLSFSSIAA